MKRLIVVAYSESHEQTGLANARITDKDKFEEVIAKS